MPALVKVFGCRPKTEGAERSIENMRYMGDAVVTNIKELRQTLSSMPKD